MSTSSAYGIRKRTLNVPPSVAAAHRLEQQDALMEIQSEKRKKKHRPRKAKAKTEEASEPSLEIKDIIPHQMEEIR